MNNNEKTHDFYTVYETTNLLNGKIYVGVHATNDLLDNYLGSGITLKRAIRKHGRKHFRKRILFLYSDIDKAYSKEKEIVNDEFVRRHDTYNMTTGGSKSIEFSQERINRYKLRSGPNHWAYGKKFSKQHRQKISRGGLGRKWSKETHEKMESLWQQRKNSGYISPTRGRSLSDKDKKKKSIAALNKKKFQCPHCLKVTDPGNLKLWHLDKCKLRI